MRRILALAAAAALVSACQQQDGVLRIAAPASPTYTNGSVTVTVDVGGPVDRLDLLVDDEVVASLEAPPWSWGLDTAPLAEGTHALRARAEVSGRSVTSDPVTLVVDRTPPRVVDLEPSGMLSLFPGRPLELLFDEPVAISDPPGLALTAGDAAVPATVTTADGLGFRIEPASADVREVTLVLDGTVVDRAGNAFAYPSTLWRGFAYPIAPVATVEWPPIAWVPARSVGAAVTPDGVGFAAFAGTGPENSFAFAGTREAWSGPASIPIWNGYSVAATPGGEILVATMEPVRVHRFTGSSLEGMGPALADSGATSLTVDASGLPLLAWSDAAGVHVASWDPALASFASSIPPLSLDGRIALLHEVAGDASRPMVRVETWPVGGGAAAMQLYRWSGAAWIAAPPPVLPAHSGAFAGEDLLLATGPRGAPLVVVTVSPGPSPRVFVWDGAAWQEPWTAPPIFGGPVAVAVDASGHPMILHNDWFVGLGLTWHDGSDWVPVAPAGALSRYWIDVAALAAGPGNTALVAWSEEDRTLDFARWITW